MLENPGVWRDVSPQGQFLLDAEFLTRNTAPPPLKTKPTVVADTACVYTTCPSYLTEISQQFPWVHFFAFNCPVSWQTPAAATGEYDPAQPELVTETCPTLQTELNRTTSPYEFSKDSALTLSRTNEADPTRHRLVMICHGETAVRQMVLHVLLRADFSLLDICGPVPAEYLTGELVLPVMLPWNRMFALLVVDRECKGRSYNPETFAEEMGASLFFSGGVCVSDLDNRVLPEHDAGYRGVRPRQQGFNHQRIRSEVLVVPPVRPRVRPVHVQGGGGHSAGVLRIRPRRTDAMRRSCHRTGRTRPRRCPS
jgi:hypothetical protein